MADATDAGARVPNRAKRALLELHERHMAWMRASGMGGLLVVLAFGIFVLPALTAEGEGWRIITDVMLTLILVFGVIAIVEHRRISITLIVVSILVVGARWSEWFLPMGDHPILREASTLMALIVLAVAVGINVFAKDRALSDRIFGGIVLYLLLGLMWAVVYAFVWLVVPGAFAGRDLATANLFDWGYFSLVTMTTVGYGDITPVARVARSLATAEALIGQLYPAIIIARLVSLPGPGR
jgi:hypothetical protein